MFSRVMRVENFKELCDVRQVSNLIRYNTREGKYKILYDLVMLTKESACVCVYVFLLEQMIGAHQPRLSPMLVAVFSRALHQS